MVDSLDNIEKIDFSVVVPFFNEEENVRPMYALIVESLKQTRGKYEMVFVDDGSQDGTLPALQTLVCEDDRVRVVQLRRNFGQTPAISAGIDHARGQIIVTMDGDLQNDPRDIPSLVQRIEQGADLVTGWRRDRKDPFLTRRLPSIVANWLVAKAAHVPIHDTGCSLKAYRAELIKGLPLYSELHRFMPAMSTLATGRIEEVVVRHHARRYGSSKYGLSRIRKVILDLLMIKMLLSCSQRPRYWFGTSALAAFVLAVVVAICGIPSVLGPTERSSFLLLSVSVLFFYLGIHLTSAGMFAELIVRTGVSAPRPLVRHVRPSSRRESCDQRKPIP